MFFFHKGNLLPYLHHKSLNPKMKDEVEIGDHFVVYCRKNDIVNGMKEKSLQRQLEEKISQGKLRVFSTSDFRYYGEYKAIAKSLERLTKEGKITRLSTGLYGKKVYNARFGDFEEIMPEEIADGLARKFGWKIVPAGEAAANLLGLSTQVPTQSVYISTGPYKTYRIGSFKIVFRHSFHKELALCSETTALFSEALREIGPHELSYANLKAAIEALDEKDKITLENESTQLSPWLAKAIQDALGA
jgi:hypothetical protein